MTYQAWRKQSILEAFDLQLREIVQRYKPGERTVCMLPGGMGSQLEISKRKYNAGNPIPSLPESTIWTDVGITADDAFRLEIEDGYDFKKRAVSPFGPVRFLPLLDPYIFLKNFINDDKGWNYVSFGFDWRRSLTESAHMLHYFLEEFRDRVKGKWEEDLLPTTNLVCHSMGGLMAMRFVHLLVGELGVSPAAV